MIGKQRSGVPVSETDPNSVTTGAEYDGLGRMTKVIKPGDSSGSPSVSLSYNVAVLPFYTQAVQKIDASTSLTVRKVYDGLGRLI